MRPRGRNRRIPARTGRSGASWVDRSGANQLDPCANWRLHPFVIEAADRRGVALTDDGDQPASIAGRIRAVFDPAGIMNPGIMRIAR